MRTAFYDNMQCNILMENLNQCFNFNRSILEGYPDSLERQVGQLDKEVMEDEEKENADRIDYILTYDLDRFQQDMTRARRGGVISDAVAARCFKKHASYVLGSLIK